MTVNYLYSDAKAQEALAVIGDERIATTTTDLARQLLYALANRTATSGTPLENVEAALGGYPPADEFVFLLKQCVVVAATT